MIVFITIGLPGSGKSTAAERCLLAKPSETITCCADDYPGLYTKKGIDFSLLGKAHAWCFRNFLDALGENREVIWCTNTNTTLAEIAPYIAAARAYGVEPIIQHYNTTCEVAYHRNTHGVPLVGIQVMASKIEKARLDWPPFWPEVNVINT